MSLADGSRLEHYEIVELHGAGGMGEVYRAVDTKLRREVAIKILPPKFAADASRLARFEREAHLLAAPESSQHRGDLRPGAHRRHPLSGVGTGGRADALKSPKLWRRRMKKVWSTVI